MPVWLAANNRLNRIIILANIQPHEEIAVAENTENKENNLIYTDII